jgi:hypothetical protein
MTPPLALAMRKHPRACAPRREQPPGSRQSAAAFGSRSLSPPAVGSRSASAARVGAGGTGKRAVRSTAFDALVDATRSPTAPRVSDLAKEPTKASKTTRSASAPPVRPVRRGEFEGVACKYALGSFDEFHDTCRRLTDETMPEDERLTY